MAYPWSYMPHKGWFAFMKTRHLLPELRPWWDEIVKMRYQRSALNFIGWFVGIWWMIPIATLIGIGLLAQSLLPFFRRLGSGYFHSKGDDISGKIQAMHQTRPLNQEEINRRKKSQRNHNA